METNKWVVNIVEYESGWGSKVDAEKFFINWDDANKFVNDYNKQYNAEKTIPNWYMVAQGPFRVINGN